MCQGSIVRGSLPVEGGELSRNLKDPGLDDEVLRSRDGIQI